jgi:hypothetical protein
MPIGWKGFLRAPVSFAGVLIFSEGLFEGVLLKEKWIE